jgi:hypothetical protein
VRYVFEGVVYGFETAIVEAISSPLRLLFLAYPKLVTARTIRSNPRVNHLAACAAQSRRHRRRRHGHRYQHLGVPARDPARQLARGRKARRRLGRRSHAATTGVGGDFQIRGKLRSLRTASARLEAGISFGELEEQVQLAIDAYVKLAD